MGGTLARLPLRMQGRTSKLFGEIVAASQLWSIHRTTQRLHPGWSGCYDTRAAPGSGACRKARDGACVRHAEEVSGQRKSLKVIGRQTSGTCPEANSGASQTGQCKNGKCDIWIGGGDFCSQCSQTTDYLINGKCTADNTESACEGSASNGMCTSCKSGYFLHRGGCYQIGMEPGNLVCKDTAASINQGTCDECQAGYFRNPVTGLDKAKESCIACNQTTAVDYNTGVANCAECTTPAARGSGGTAKCTKCTGPNYLMTATDGSTSCVSKCPEGYFEHTSDAQKKTCQSCSGENAGLTPAGAGVAGCAACTYDNTKVTCTKCEASKYLKTTSDSTSCVEASGCGSGFFPKADDKAGNRCASCREDSSGGIENCAECSLFPYK